MAEERSGGAETVSGAANPHGGDPEKYAPNGAAPPPAQQMRHEVAAEEPISVQETSGVAAAEATGKIRTDNEADAEETAGSG